MDIITRLKFFMDSAGIQSSQFADTCNIPRPTLSQLLNGRNKKVSDEIIAKVHTGFPDLSVMWLLFGEGSMYSDGNNQFSDPQNTRLPHSFDKQDTECQNNTEQKYPNIFEGYYRQSSDLPPHINNAPQKSEKSVAETHNNNENAEERKPTSDSPMKKITSILVFYDDNSFESFVPSGDTK